MKVAHRVEISDIKYNEEDNIEYKELSVFDKNDDLIITLEVDTDVDINNYFEKTGILIGFSGWVFD